MPRLRTEIRIKPQKIRPEISSFSPKQQYFSLEKLLYETQTVISVKPELAEVKSENLKPRIIPKKDLIPHNHGFTESNQTIMK